MEPAEDLPTAEELVRQYLALILAANGEATKHWSFARVLHYIARRVLQSHYFHHGLSSAEEAELFEALEELHKCPLRQHGVPGAWQQVQQRLGRVVPLVQQLLAQ